MSEIEAPASQVPVALGSTGDSQAGRSDSSGQPALTEQQQRQLQVFSATLLSPSTDIEPETRRSAAQELLVMNIPQSLAVIDRALRSGTPSVVIGAATAMQSSRPVPSLLEPAIAALKSAAPTAIEPLSWAIARHGDAAVQHLARLATDQSADVQSRLGAIRALGKFDSKPAAVALMAVVDSEGEAVEFVSAACDSLQRLSGLPHNSDIRLWRAWWSQARDLAPDQWSVFINQSLSNRAVQLQQDLQKQHEANERIARELVAAYRDLYPTLPVEEQWRRLTGLLQDPAQQIREFAIARIALLLRDSVRIPPELQAKVADRLNDDVPSIRTEAAKLLDEANYEAIGSHLAKRLSVEQNPQVAATFLEVLSRRSCPEAVEPARKWIADAVLGDRAANAIWRAAQSQSLPDNQLEALREELRGAIELRQSAAAMRVLALCGTDADVARLTEALDRSDAAIRAAIGEGFCQRGLRQPLIQRAADATVYPFALLAILQGPADLSSLRQIISLPPDAGAKPLWIDACNKICETIPAQDVLAADDLLLSTALIEPTVRLALLDRATAQLRDKLSAEHFKTLALRQAEILIASGESSKAHQLLESVGCSGNQVAELCFKAAALSGNYEKASQVHETSAPWVALLVTVANQDTVQAAPLFNEITRRFAGRLSTDEQEQLNRVAQLLQSAAASAGASGIGFAFPR